jgi:dCMP deaminase
MACGLCIHVQRSNQLETIRPSFESIYMNLAHSLAKRSTCSRLQVGCVITSPDFRKVIAVGYNGGASGLENECASLEAGKCLHLHAEENAVINCDVPRDTKKYVFCSNLPCIMCAKRLINLGGVQRVYYELDYRIHDGIDLLKRACIEVFTFHPNEEFQVRQV